MEERRYLISDAAKLVAVEAHVLRYWEEELGLSVGRTELGHRYYTRENIEQFRTVKKLKEEGLQLRAIKSVLQDEDGRQARQKAQGMSPDWTEEERFWKEQTPKEKDGQQDAALLAMRTNAKKLELFTELVQDIVERAVRDNNEELQRRMEESMERETNYLLHMQEKYEEEHFRRLDEVIRLHQENSRYAAAAREKRRFFDWLRRD